MDLKAVVSRRFYEKPKDGESCTISGILKPCGEALISPFTQTSCVAYEFEITHDIENSESTSEGFDAKGAEMAQSVISGDMPELKICGRPIFEGFEKRSFPYGWDDEIDENANDETTNQPVQASQQPTALDSTYKVF